MARILGDAQPSDLGVAVSGGGDSTALMHLAAGWGAARLHVLTVDHGLRPGVEAEAEAVARQAAALGLSHAIRQWRWDGVGNLQAAAREGRRRLLRDWAEREGLPAVLLGHTLDDQAETLVMRLARGSGVEGLSAMEEERLEARGAESGNTPFLRPLLSVPRADLRAWLRERGIPWADDPSNDDPRFERVRARRAIEALGLDPRRLAATAARMARARRALELRALDTASVMLRPCLAGEVRLAREALRRADEDTRLRILAGALRCVAGASYRPREDDLLRVAAGVVEGAQRTLHGCVVRPEGETVLIHREPAAVAALRALAGAPWDGAWRLDAAEGEVRALGEEGLRQALSAPPGGSDWPEADAPPLAPPGHPRAALAAKPALWRGDRLVGFAFLRFGAPHRVRWRPPGGAFPACLLTRGAEPDAAP